VADAALDLDALFKAACYGLVEDVLSVVPTPPHAYGILGSTRYVLPKKLQRGRLQNLAAAEQSLQKALDVLEVLEPTSEEIALAASLEYEATRQQQSVHGGECVLCALLVRRCLTHVLTGDKSAIRGLAAMVLPAEVAPASLAAKWACFEQVVLWLCQRLGAPAVRARVCAEPSVDTGLRLCFSCSAPEVDESSWREGLLSHIRDLRKHAGDVLMPGPD
jgi:hypothetical protein